VGHCALAGYQLLSLHRGMMIPVKSERDNGITAGARTRFWGWASPEAGRPRGVFQSLMELRQTKGRLPDIDWQRKKNFRSGNSQPLSGLFDQVG